MWAERSVTPDTNTNTEETQTLTHTDRKKAPEHKWIKIMFFFLVWNLADNKKLKTDAITSK